MTERADREVSLGIEQTFGNALRELIVNPNWQAFSIFYFRFSYCCTIYDSLEERLLPLLYNSKK